MARALVDTGAIVALFNVDDPHHAAASAWFKRFRGQLLIELAEREGVATIATIDQRDFSVFRMRKRRRFRILLP